MSDGKTAGTSVAEKVHRDRALLRFDRLRSLRGSRQYLFATRSPGIVVSGDAEQIVTIRRPQDTAKSKLWAHSNTTSSTPWRWNILKGVGSRSADAP